MRNSNLTYFSIDWGIINLFFFCFPFFSALPKSGDQLLCSTYIFSYKHVNRIVSLQEASVAYTLVESQSPNMQAVSLICKMKQHFWSNLNTLLLFSGNDINCAMCYLDSSNKQVCSACKTNFIFDYKGICNKCPTNC